MTIVIKESCEWLKEIITINEGKEEDFTINMVGIFWITCIHQKGLQNLIHGETSLKNSKHCLRMFKN
jgi:hypothetical protein